MKRILPLLMLSAIVIGSCKKDSPDNKKNPAVPATLQMTETNLKTFQLVELQVKNHTLVQSSYSGSLNEVALNLIKVDDSTLVFMVPENVSGSARLKVEIAENDIEVQVSTISVSNPDQVIADNILTLISELDELESFIDTASLSADINKAQIKQEIQTLRQEYQFQVNAYNNLGTEDKKVCAAFLLANKPFLDELAASDDEWLTTYKGKIDGNCLNETLRIRVMSCKLENFLNLVYKLGTRAVVGVAVGALIGNIPGALVGGALVGLAVEKYYHKAVIAWDAYAAEKWQLVSVDDLLVNKQRKEFIHGLPEQIYFSVKTRNIQNTDGSKGGLAAKMIRAYNKVMSLAETFEFDNLPSFKPQGFASYPPEALQYISLEINNAKVKYTLSGKADSIMLKFTTDESTNQDFSFKVVYDDGENLIKSESVDAVVKKPTVLELLNLYGPWKSNVQGNLYFKYTFSGLSECACLGTEAYQVSNNALKFSESICITKYSDYAYGMDDDCDNQYSPLGVVQLTAESLVLNEDGTIVTFTPWK